MYFTGRSRHCRYFCVYIFLNSFNMRVFVLISSVCLYEPADLCYYKN